MAKKAVSAELDPDLVAACEALTLDPASVLAFRVYEERVVVIDADGRKLQVER